MKRPTRVDLSRMLTRFRDELKLEKFQILFDLEDIEVYDDEWNAMPGHEDSNIDWKTTSGRPPENSKLLEMFTRGICSWPMEDHRPQWSGCWRRLDGWEDQRLRDRMLFCPTLSSKFPNYSRCSYRHSFGLPKLSDLRPHLVCGHRLELPIRPRERGESSHLEATSFRNWGRLELLSVAKIGILL